MACATALGQALAWTVETVRRGPQGILLVRLLGLLVGALAVWVQLSGHVTDVLDSVPTIHVMRGMVAAPRGRLAPLGPHRRSPWWRSSWPPSSSARSPRTSPPGSPRATRSASRPAPGWPAVRPAPTSTALIRIDRGSVWRSVPMRRGLTVLAVGPGLVALAGNLGWDTMTILPGLVASGGALLFGVNAWVLDGRGTLWRESLPAAPSTVFAARVVVLTEWLFVASGVTLVLASLRAGLPEPHELTALLATWVVVVVQVVGASMRWSSQRPFSVDMRSARATPAPPIVMVGYSARLALSTTLTGLVFSGLAKLPIWNLSLAVMLPFLLWSLVRLVWVRRTWLDPVERARVVMTVAA